MASNFHQPSKFLKDYDLRPPEDVIKGGVQLDANIRKYLPFSASIATSRPPDPFVKTLAIFEKGKDTVEEFVERVAKDLGQPPATESNTYAIMFDDQSGRFLTEHNKDALQQGCMLLFTASPENYARVLLADLEPSKNASMSMLLTLSSDVAFAKALQARQGVRKIVATIESGSFEARNGSFEVRLPALHQLLQTFLVLMNLPNSNIVTPEDVTPGLVERVASYVNGRAKWEDNDSLFLSLNILHQLLVGPFPPPVIDAIKREAPFEVLIRHLENSDKRILLNALILMVNLHSKGDATEKARILLLLHGRPFRAAVELAIRRQTQSPDQLIREQLLALQEILLEDLGEMVKRVPTEQEVQYVMALDEWGNQRPAPPPPPPARLRSSHSPSLNSSHNSESMEEQHSSSMVDILNSAAAAEEDELALRVEDAERFKRLVQRVPPGSLAICTILNYIKPAGDRNGGGGDDHPHRSEEKGNGAFREIQLESTLRLSVWPVVLVHLTTSLIHVLSIPTGPSTPTTIRNHPRSDFQQLILKLEHPFYEIFPVAVQLFHRTWREMKAHVEEDMGKVAAVVLKQLEKAFHLNPSSLEELEGLIKRFSYAQMNEIWESERIEREELELNSASIQALKEHLRPHIEQLVLRRRMCSLKKGQVFSRPATAVEPGVGAPMAVAAKASSSSSSTTPAAAAKGGLWCWRLEENERHLFHTDYQPSPNGKQTDPNISTTPTRVPVSRIARIIHGVDYNNQFSQLLGVGGGGGGKMGEGARKKSSASSSLLKCGLCIELKASNYQQDEQRQLHLLANSEPELAVWIEGLQCLIDPKKAAQSPQLKAEIDRMLNLEVRVRLLEVPVSGVGEAPPKLQFSPLKPPTDLSWIPEKYRCPHN